LLTEKLRKQAVDKATSPEQLDAMLTVASPKGALGIMVLATTLVLALGWSAYSSAPIKVSGQGILLTSGEVFSVTADANGRVSHPNVYVGSKVSKGDVLIELGLTALEDRIEAAQTKLASLERNVDQITRQNVIAARAAELLFQQEQRHSEQLINRAETALGRIKSELEDRRKLFAEGLVTTASLEAAEARYEEAAERLAVAKVDSVSINPERIRASHERDLALEVAKDELTAQSLLLEQLIEERSQKKFVRASHDGEVVATMVSFNDVVVVGQPLFEIVAREGEGRLENTIQAIIYTKSADAAQLEEGDVAQVVPASARLERDGYVVGVVRHVARVPATQASIINRLRNPEFANAMLQNGPVNEVTVDLQKDEQTVSGFRWSSPRGDTLHVNPGTTAVSHMVVGRKRILSFVIPGIDRYLPPVAASVGDPVQQGRG